MSSSATKGDSRCDHLCGLFSLVSSLLVYGTSLFVIATMVYNQYSVKWTFICYVASSGWLLIMNILSNVLMITGKKTVKRGNRVTCRQTSVNLDLLNHPDGNRYLSYPPAQRFEQANRIRLSELASHTPPPSYEDVSQVSEENNNASFSSGGTQEPSNEKAMYEVLESANEMKKVREVLKSEYTAQGIEKTQRYSPRGSRKSNSSRRGSDSNHQVVVEMEVQNLDGENPRRVLHQRIEDRRDQLDRRLEGESLRKMNEYCLRDLKREMDIGKRSPRRPTDLTPKESLRRNLKAKYGHSADNLIDMHSSRESLKSAHQFRNIERCELPRVHAKSTQSLKLPDGNSQRSVKSSKSSGISASGLSLPDEAHMRGSQPDIRTANEVGLPLDRTWKQKPQKLPDRATTNVNLDTSFSLKHLEDRKKLDGNPCGRSKSMPGRQRSRENEDGRF